MITNKDLEIENISYTNKDFGQIYPELVDLAKSLTNKWDPSSTNESDPGIVLLKLIGFLGDKLNYNIDKNTLEQFITSATQESSVRKLCDMMAYPVHYYRSSTTNISFRYTGVLGSDSEEAQGSIASLSHFTIKAFDTTFKTEDDIIYTLLEDIVIDKNISVQSTDKIAIQGELHELTVLSGDNTSNLIQLSNLENNRLYFPEAQVAENGVFVNKNEGVYNAITNPNSWHRVDNLNDQQLGQKVFKFSYDSVKSLPYIQFPVDIADLIGEGLTIDYIVSSGVLGKVLNNKLTSFDKCIIVDEGNTQIQETLDESNFVLSNSESVGAEDPEKINDIVSSFNKVVGTFDTLVSCKDYSNYLNNYTGDDGNRLVSQVTVCDVRTDPNLSSEIFTRAKESYDYYAHKILSGAQSDIFNLYLHGTTAIDSDINSKYLYDRTYNPVTLSDINIKINPALYDIKTLTHYFALPIYSGNTDNYYDIIIGNYKLQTNISTKYKLNSSEQKDVINNVKKALYQNFNASKLDFGQEIPYDSLVEVMLNADSRIKNINLAEPTINYLLRDRNQEGILLDLNSSDNSQVLAKLVASNVVAGRLPYCKIDDSFKFDWKMNLTSDSVMKNNLCGIVGSFNYDDSDELKKNESIQLVEDSYVATLSYPYGINYAFYTSSVTAGTKVIDKNTIYELGENDHLYIFYTDSSNKYVFKEYKENDIIQPTFDIYNTSGLDSVSTGSSTLKAIKYVSKITHKPITVDNWEDYEDKVNVIPMYIVGSDDQIDILELNSYKLPGKSSCFWYIKPKINLSGSSVSFVNEHNDLLFTQIGSSDLYEYILEEGEFFIYPNDDMTTLSVLGSGTRLISNVATIERSADDYIDISELQESIADQDVGTFKKAFKWEELPYNVEIEVRETNVSTFIEGDSIHSETTLPTISSIWSPLSDRIINVQYSDGSTDELTISSLSNPEIRTVLSINGSSDNPQKVGSGQSVTLIISTNTDSEEVGTHFTYSTISINNYIQIAPAIDTYNNLGVLQTIKYIEDENGILVPNMDGTYYLHEAKYYKMFNYSEKSTPYSSGTVSYFIDQYANHMEKMNSRGEYIINYVPGMSSSSLSTGINQNLGLSVEIFNSHDVTTNIQAGQTNINISSWVTAADSSSPLYISNPIKLVEYDYVNDSRLGGNLSSAIAAIENEFNCQYDALGEMNPYKYISYYDPIMSFFDPNNIYNSITIAKIDFDNSEFNIIGSFR